MLYVTGLDTYLNSEMAAPSQGTPAHVRLLDVVLRGTPASLSLPTHLALHLMTHLHRADQLGKQLNILRRIHTHADVVMRWDHVVFCHTLFLPYETLQAQHRTHAFTLTRSDLSIDARHTSIQQLIHVAVMCCAMSTTSVLQLQVKPQASRVTYDTTERSDAACHTWRQQLASIQRAALCWCHTHMIRHMSASDGDAICGMLSQCLLLHPQTHTLVQQYMRVCGDWSWEVRCTHMA